MLKALKLSRIEAKPKRIYFAKRWRSTVDLDKNPHLANALADIVEAIKRGHTLPVGSYRLRIDDTRDELLETTGIMHLHLGDSHSRELVFLLQFPQFVIFLEATDHYHFTTDPPGSLLVKFHEQKLEEQLAEIETGMKDAIKSGLKPKR